MIERLILFAILLIGAPIHAQTETGKATLDVLNDQTRILDRISPTIERIDQARILVIRRAITEVITDIETNKKEGRSEITFQTMRLMQYLIVQYRFSHVFLGWEETPSLISIYTPSTEKDLNQLRESYQKLQTSFGIDDTPYTKVTAHYFRQLEKLLKQLESLPIEGSLKDDLRELLPPIARTIAIAEQGDRPKAFRAAEKLIPLLRDFYPRFNAVSNSNAGFSAVLEIQGLTETYAEFSQFDQPSPEEEVCR